MSNRLLAIIGSIAYGVRQFVGALLSLVGLRELDRFAVPLLILVFAGAAALSARDTATVLASRPEVTETTLAEVAAYGGEGGSIWFAFDALLDETSLSTPADLGTFFYLARDPEDPATGLLVRSNLNDHFMRTRVVSARIVEDEGVVASAIESLGPLPSGFNLDTTRYLDEVAAGGKADLAFNPSQLEEEPDQTELLVTGRVVSPAEHAACATEAGCEGGDATWLYYLADPNGNRAIVLRSPHPPDAVPVRLQGLYQRDTYDLAPVLESEWYAGLDADVPIARAFSAGSRPPITVPASWVPTIIFGVIALLLLASHLVGYPVFRGRERPAPARQLGVGQGVDVQITGRLARESGAIALERSPGAVERLSIADLALRMWRYGVLPRELSRREAEERFLADAAGETDRLVVHERDQSALVMVERDPGVATVERGRLYRLASSAPAVHLRQRNTNAYLTVAGIEDRDRVAAEIQGEIEAGGAGS